MVAEWLQGRWERQSWGWITVLPFSLLPGLPSHCLWRATSLMITIKINNLTCRLHPPGREHLWDSFNHPHFPAALWSTEFGSWLPSSWGSFWVHLEDHEMKTTLTFFFFCYLPLICSVGDWYCGCRGLPSSAGEWLCFSRSSVCMKWWWRQPLQSPH